MLSRDYKKIALPTIVFSLSIGLSFATQAFLGHYLGLSGFGYYSALYGLVTIIGGGLTFGLDTSALKFLSNYFANQNIIGIKQFNRFSLFVVLFGGLIFIIFVSISQGVLFAHGIDFPVVAGLSAIFLALSKLFASSLRAINFTSLSLVVDRIIRESAICIAVIVCATIWKAADIKVDLQWAIFFGCFTGFLAAAFFVWKFRPTIELSQNFSNHSRREWLRTSSAMWTANLLELAFSRVEVIFLAYFSTLADAGKFAILNTLSSLVILPLLALNVVFQPKIAAINSAENRSELKAVISQFVKLSLPPTFIVGLAILAFPSLLLRLFGSSEIDQLIIYCLYALVISRLALSAIGPTASILLMTEGHVNVAAVYAVALPLKIMFLFVAIPKSSNAVVLATVVSVMFIISVQLTMYFVLKKKLNLSR